MMSLTVACAPMLASCYAAPTDGGLSVDGDTASNPVTANAGGSAYTASQYTEVPGGLPLTPYFDAYHRLDEAVRTGQSARERAAWGSRLETEIAECMKKAGFEYHPSQRETAEEVDPSPVAMLEGDLVGVPYLPDTIEQVRAIGYGKDPIDEVSEAPVDPTAPDLTEEDVKNQEYVENLSASARAAYFKALDGWDGTDEGVDKLTGGCAAAAGKKYPEPVPHDDVIEVRELHGGIIGGLTYLVGQGVPTDDAVVELDRDWVSCMHGTGYEFGRGGPGGDGWSPFRPPTLAMITATLTGADGIVATPSAGEPDFGEDQQRLIGSQAEIAIAVADFECRQETDYMDTLIGRTRAMQEEFIAENQEALDQFMAAVEELGL
ncbi:MAG: hypothetical protein LBK95_06510 [Bifidobacteriaceae bacterium]|jgi:hypothetical protein|nr:hypothetical protein [Bifidobacteriaceae bacterium]